MRNEIAAPWRQTSSLRRVQSLWVLNLSSCTLVRKQANLETSQSTPAAPPTIPAPPQQVIPADTVYAALGDPTRRRLLQILADSQRRTVTVLAGNVGKRLDATLKHLVALRGAGLVITAENPQDGRRLLYHLAPAIPATKSERGWEMDLGYWLVRG